ncbi:MAG: type III pantothenate kinase [Nitrospiraceae bacterium]|nr:MAG: type III pantothenate kinase [Nitrospiraceae bacterium]
MATEKPDEKYCHAGAMLIAADIGNSTIKIGYFTDSGLIVQKLRTNMHARASEYSTAMNAFMADNNIEKKNINGIISSVVDGLSERMGSALRGFSGDRDMAVLTVNHRMNTGLHFRIAEPGELGADRIANAIGAYEILNSPVAVLDFGTATTVTVVNQDAEYLGGSILPGIGLMNKMLGQGTSKLEQVSLEPPQSALGKDTAACIRSGLFFGTAGAVERIIAELEEENHCGLSIVMTGGFSGAMDSFIGRPHVMHPHLTLEGLKILYEKNRYA